MNPDASWNFPLCLVCSGRKMEDDADANLKTSLFKLRGSFCLTPERYHAAVATATQTFLSKVLQIKWTAWKANTLFYTRTSGCGRTGGKISCFYFFLQVCFSFSPASTWELWCNPPCECSCTARWTRSSPAAVNQTQTQTQSVS